MPYSANTPARRRFNGVLSALGGRAKEASMNMSAQVCFRDQLLDGTHVIVRPLGPEDAELEKSFLDGLSSESLRYRFLGAIGHTTPEFIRQLVNVDTLRDVAFVALVHHDGHKQEVGVSRFSTSADGMSCECAVVVADAWRHRGLGTVLMKHLIDVARGRGIREMVSLDSADNTAMRDLAHYLGFTRESDPGDPAQVIHRLRLQRVDL